MNRYDAIVMLESLTNRAREQAGLAPLTLDDRLQAIAQQRADEMAQGNWFSHDWQEKAGGGDFLTMLRDAGIPFRFAAENLGKINSLSGTDLQDIHDRWLESPLHRMNLLGAFTNVGIGVASGADGQVVLCVLFDRE